jgi:hypothetical protein
MGFYDVARSTEQLTHSETNLLVSSSKSLERTDQFGADLACYAHHDWYEWKNQVTGQCVLHLACGTQAAPALCLRVISLSIQKVEKVYSHRQLASLELNS